MGRVPGLHPLLAPDEQAVTEGLLQLAQARREGGLTDVVACRRRRDVLLFIDGDEEAQQSQIQHKTNHSFFR
ncbi:hypothetical protein D3C76_1270920 [compost metagenome]